jgi:catechol 2,3-dioxygenase-like lactoylglutathione lyase family enzyme
MSSLISGGNATIFVSDFDRAVKFYVETLGLKLAYRAENHWASIDAGKGLMLGLHPVSPNAAKPGTVGAIEVGFQVSPPMKAVVDAFTARGVKFRGPARSDDGGITLAHFNDPDGNPLYLFCFGQ